MLSSIHHRTLSLLILCTVLLAPSLLLGGVLSHRKYQSPAQGQST